MTLILEYPQLSYALPDPTQKLSTDFIKTFGRPALLTLPSKLALAANDFSGNWPNNNGVLNGGITTTPGGWGTLSQSWAFSRAAGNQYISIPNSPALNPSTITVVAVILTNVGSVTQAICSKDSQPTSNRVWQFRINTNVLQFIPFNASTNGAVSGTTSVFDGKAHLVAGQWDGSTITVWLDGQLNCTPVSFSGALRSGQTNQVTIGRDDTGLPGGANYFGGNIYFTEIFPFALSAAQHAQLYQSLLTGQPFPLFSIDNLYLDEPSTGTIINLTAKSFVFTSSNAQESVSKPLNSQEVSQSDSQGNISLTKNLRSDVAAQSVVTKATSSINQGKSSQAVLQSESNARETIQRVLSSNTIICQSRSLAEISVKKNLNSTSLSLSSANGNFTTQVVTKYKLMSYRRYSSQYLVQSGSINDDGR